METLFMVLIFIICILLIGVILIQNSKGGGLATGFSSGNQFGGVKKTSDFLEKSTWSLVIALMLLSIIYTINIDRNNSIESPKDSLEEKLNN